VTGELGFERDGTKVTCPLLFCPSEKGQRFSTPGWVGSVNEVVHVSDGLAPIGGQYVRRDIG